MSNSKYMASIPVPLVEETEIDFTDYAQDKAKNFVGRRDVLQEIQENRWIEQLYHS